VEKCGNPHIPCIRGGLSSMESVSRVFNGAGITCINSKCQLSRLGQWRNEVLSTEFKALCRFTNVVQWQMVQIMRAPNYWDILNILQLKGLTCVAGDFVQFVKFNRKLFVITAEAFIQGSILGVVLDIQDLT
jgi:hypothetical protein